MAVKSRVRRRPATERGPAAFQGIVWDDKTGEVLKRTDWGDEEKVTEQAKKAVESEREKAKKASAKDDDKSSGAKGGGDLTPGGQNTGSRGDSADD